MEKRKQEVKGKIVLFNPVFDNYSHVVQYRFDGSHKVAENGGLAMIIRSITPKSIGSPHTGVQYYQNGTKQIPAAAISLEDADMFQRMADRKQKIVVNLYMEGHLEEPKVSYNIMGEMKGTENPNEIVLIGGHLDSWDIGPQTGANDDGAGVYTCFEALRLLKTLNLTTKRTVRFIAWTGEEMGLDNAGHEEYIR